MDMVKLCVELGAAKAVEVPVDRLVFRPEVRRLCEQNTCGRFGRNYSCPPFVGEVYELIVRLKSFRKAVIWQNIYPLEDPYDFEGMTAAQTKHNAMTMEAARQASARLGKHNILVLSAGGCFLCDKCAAISQTPCRNPEAALSSLEAYGMSVSETCKAVGLNYINGANTVTYFSGCFY